MQSDFDRCVVKKIKKVPNQSHIIDLSGTSFSVYDEDDIKTMWLSVPEHVKAINLSYCFLNLLPFQKFKALISNIPEQIESLALSYNFLYQNKNIIQLLACIPHHIKELDLEGNGIFLEGNDILKTADLILELCKTLPSNLKSLNLLGNLFNPLDEANLQFFLTLLPIDLQELKIENFTYKSIQNRQAELLEKVQTDSIQNREMLLTDSAYYISKGDWVPKNHLLRLIDLFIMMNLPEAKLLSAFLLSSLWQMHEDDDAAAQELELEAIKYFLQAANSPLLLNIVQFHLWHRWVTTPFDLVKQQLADIRMEPPFEFVSQYGLFAEGTPDENQKRLEKPTLEQYIHQLPRAPI